MSNGIVRPGFVVGLKEASSFQRERGLSAQGFFPYSKPRLIQ